MNNDKQIVNDDAAASKPSTTDRLLAELIFELSGIREELEQITLACRQINEGVRGAA